MKPVMSMYSFMMISDLPLKVWSCTTSATRTQAAASMEPISRRLFV